MIFIINGQRVMLDSDLAKLYGVETRVLNQAVKRNIERFPEDFMIEPNSSQLSELRSQIVISQKLSSEKVVFNFRPRLFTENGVAMLSGIINSPRAIQVNIAIMRTFTRLRSFLSLESNLENRLNEVEKGTNKLFKIVFERLDGLEEQLTPSLKPNRKKIGIDPEKN